MGNCTITVQVTGAHHNGHNRDIDHLAKNFVAALQASGHIVAHAALTNGSTEELHHHRAPPPSHAPTPYRNDD